MLNANIYDSPRTPLAATLEHCPRYVHWVRRTPQTMLGDL